MTTIRYKILDGDEVHAAGLEDYAAEDRCFCVRFVDGNPVKIIGRDCGEPEDNTFGRDWSWVDDALNDALVEGAAMERERIAAMFDHAPSIAKTIRESGK